MRRYLVALASLALIACNQADEPQPKNGRWTIIYSPHVQRSTMLIDTATGQTWNLVSTGPGDDAGYAWERVNKISDFEAVETPPTDSSQE